MKRRYSLFLLILGFGVGVTPAWANQPPGPLVSMPEILMLPLMMAFTAMGGGYVVLKRLEKKKRGWLKAILAVVVIFLSGIQAGLAALVCLLFGLIALFRGFQMMTWGFSARSQETTPVHLTDVNQWRLIISGFLLIVVVLFLTSMALAFTYFSPIPPHRIERRIEGRVAEEIARARLEKMETGVLRFHEKPDGAGEWKNPNEMGHIRNAVIEYSRDHNGFTLYVLPHTPYGRFNPFPFFPYYYLFAYPSYRADETGQIRMIYTRHRDERCPADAPVVRQINEEDIEKALVLIQLESESLIPKPRQTDKSP